MPNSKSKPKKNDTCDLETLGKTGFQHAGSMRAFIQGRLGKEFQSGVLNTILQHRDQEHLAQFLYREKLKRSQLRLALLFRALKHKKKVHAQRERAEIARELEHLHQLSSVHTQHFDTENYEAEVVYENTLDALHYLIDIKSQEAALTELSIEKLLIEQQALEAKHQIFDEYLADMHTLDDHALRAIINSSPAELEEKMSAIQAQLAQNHAKAIENAQTLIHHYNACIVRREAAAEILDFKATPENKALSRYYDPQGQETADIAKVMYAIPKRDNLELRKDQHNFYLVPKGRLKPEQSIDNLSQEEKQAAHKTFQSKQNQCLSVKMQIKHIHGKEREAFDARCKPELDAFKEQQATLLFLRNKSIEIQANLANMQAAGQTVPTPRPQPGQSGRAVKATKNTQQDLRRQLMMMRLSAPDKKQIQQLQGDVETLCKINPRPQKNSLSPEEFKWQVFRLKAGERITQEQMRYILALLPDSGGTVTEKNQAHFPSSTPAPTPFSTRPAP